MDIYKYMSNGVTCLGYDKNTCYNRLIKEFEKGNITYPRSDSENHFDISIIDSKSIDKNVKDILLYNDNHTFLKTDNMIQGDIFMLAKEFKLTTPASLIDDLEKAENIKIDKNEKIDLLIGIKRDRQYQENKLSIDRDNFDFEKFLIDSYSNEEITINKIEIKDI